MQGQLVCSGCRTLLVYPQGATNVCCAVCNTVTAVPPPGLHLSLTNCDLSFLSIFVILRSFHLEVETSKKEITVYYDEFLKASLEKMQNPTRNCILSLLDVASSFILAR